MKNQTIGPVGEIGKHGDFVVLREVIIVEDGEKREFYLPEGTYLGEIEANKSWKGQGTLWDQLLLKYSVEQLERIARARAMNPEEALRQSEDKCQSRPTE